MANSDSQTRYLRKLMTEKYADDPLCNIDVDEMVHWEIECQDCAYTKDFGAQMMTAQMKGTAHVKNTSHTVHLRESQVVAKLSAPGLTPELPF